MSRWISAAGICAVDAFYIEPNFPRVVELEVKIKDLPKELDGLKIVHLTDIHLVTVDKREDRALAKIDAIKPDIICLTGDYVEDDGITPGHYTKQDCTRHFRYFCYRLKAKHGVFAVSGNWDPLTLEQDIAGTGVKVLDKKSATVKIRGASLTIAGSFVVEKDMVKARPLIVLDHFPEAADNLVRAGRHADLVLAGHWHGVPSRRGRGLLAERPDLLVAGVGQALGARRDDDLARVEAALELEAQILQPVEVFDAAVAVGADLVQFRIP